MGDRGQVLINGAVLYSHWGAADLAETVRQGIAAGRWDADYLAANIFRAMVKDEIDSGLGYGIGSTPYGWAWRTVEITTGPDGNAARVRVLDSGPEGGRRDGAPPRTVIDLPIAEYAARAEIRLERCPACGSWTDLDGDQAHRYEDGAVAGFRCDQCARAYLYLPGSDRLFSAGPDGTACEVDRRTGRLIDPETTATQASTAGPSAPGGFWSDADIISVYTRAQALADGTLYDVSTLAREAGFTVPVAVTAGLMATVHDIDEGSGESETGRLWDILSVLRMAAKAAGPGRDRVEFAVSIGGEDHAMYATIGPGDDPAPVLTILMAGED
jgi:hypothetical protein